MPRFLAALLLVLAAFLAPACGTLTGSVPDNAGAPPVAEGSKSGGGPGAPAVVSPGGASDPALVATLRDVASGLKSAGDAGVPYAGLGGLALGGLASVLGLFAKRRADNAHERAGNAVSVAAGAHARMDRAGLGYTGAPSAAVPAVSP